MSTERRESGRQSIINFCRIYLPHVFTVKPADFHCKLAAVLMDAAEKRQFRGALASPRGHAKSTVMSGTILWSICYEKEKFIVAISDTISQAEEYVAFLKKELTDNELLRQDFPEVCERGSKIGPPRWTRTEIVTRNNIKVVALGANQSVRGRRHLHVRPSLIVLDDVENDEAVRSGERRNQLFEWFEKVVLKAGDERTNIMVVGTILHSDSLLARLLKANGWWRRKYKALVKLPSNQKLWDFWEHLYTGRDAEEDEVVGIPCARSFFKEHQEEMTVDSTVLWPEKVPLEMLMETRLRESRASFNSEMQNDPIDPKDCIFSEEDLCFWDDNLNEQQLLASLRGHVRIIGACDPSLGKTGGDDSAIITVAYDTKEDLFYVLDADIRRRKPDKLIEDLVFSFKRRRHNLILVEANQFQSFFSDQFTRRARELGLYPKIRKVTQKYNKVSRIEGIQPLMTAGRILFSKRHRQLIEQLLEFPLGSHDDGPDALEMAITQSRAKPKYSVEEMMATLPIIGNRNSEFERCSMPPDCIPYGTWLKPPCWR